MPETWPAPLPNPSVDFNGQLVAPTITTTFETGRKRKRARFDRENEIYGVSWLFKSREFAAFKAFWKHSLELGTLFFTVKLPVGEDDALTDVVVRFSEDGYKSTYVGYMNFRVTGTLETEAPVSESGDWLYLYEEYDGFPEDSLPMFIDLHYLVHVAAPFALTP